MGGVSEGLRGLRVSRLAWVCGVDGLERHPPTHPPPPEHIMVSMVSFRFTYFTDSSITQAATSAICPD